MSDGSTPIPTSTPAAVPTPDPQAIQTVAGPATTAARPLPKGAVAVVNTAEMLAAKAQEKVEERTMVLDFARNSLRRESPTIAQLALALSKAQGILTNAEKNAENPHFKSKYADLASVLDAARKPLADNELAIMQLPSAIGSHAIITTKLVHSSGEFIEETLILCAGQDTPQAIKSAITYGRRVGLESIVGIGSADDDGAEASKSESMAGVRRDPARGRLQEPETLPAASPAPATEAAPHVVSPPSRPAVRGRVAAPPAASTPVAAPGAATSAVPAPAAAAAVSAPSAPPPPGMKPPARVPGS